LGAEVIKCTGLQGEFIRGALNIEVQKGSWAIYFKAQDEADEFFEMLLGFKKPLSGKLILMNKELNTISKEELFALRKRIGIVFPGGGLISNLRAWENMSLPALYHRVDSFEIIKEKGLKLLEELGFKKPPLTRISELTIFERVLIGLGRVFLLMPDIIIFHRIFEGLSGEEKGFIYSFIKSRKDFEGKAMLWILTQKEEEVFIPAVIFDTNEEVAK
jgi:phospholipid/cholesterol/gamma-HCH transport system ATP-binding protein